MMDQAELLALVAKGKDAWNEWANANPDATVEFSGVEFDNDVTFDGFCFPNKTNFNEATFTGSASFNGATFTGSAFFHKATFTGRTSFSGATFTGSAFFHKATFTSDASFSKATFTSDANFNEATFTGRTSFNEATFTDRTFFYEATFTGSANFHKATFTSDAFFIKTTFMGSAFFVSVDVQGRIDFEDTEFHRIPDFHAVKNTERIALDIVEFSLSKPSSQFLKVVYWATGLGHSDRSTMVAIRQIRGIANKNHAIDTERDLTILERNAQVGAAWVTLMTRRSLVDKTVAISTEAEQGPLDRETQIGAISELWNESEPLRQWFAKFLETLLETMMLVAYRWSSKNGRSVVVPVLWLVGIFYSYRWLYGYLYGKVRSDYLEAKNVSDSLLDFTITSMVPFGSNVRPTYQIAVNNLFRPIELTMLEGRVPAMFQLVSLSQGVLTLTFVFLIGLALRNFFRMK